MKLNKRGSLWRFTDKYGFAGGTYPRDVCNLTKKILSAITSVILIITVISGLLLSLGIPLFYLIMTLITGMFIMSPVLEAFIIVVSLIVVTGTLLGFPLAMHWLFKKTNNKMDKYEAVKETKSTIKSAYKSFKDKTCVLIEYYNA